MYAVSVSARGSSLVSIRNQLAHFANWGFTTQHQPDVNQIGHFLPPFAISNNKLALFEE
jgi:hypothetical protein